MKKSNLSCLLIVFLGGLICGCDDVFEEDISDEEISIIFPQNGLLLEDFTVNFQWQDIEEIDEFRLRVRDLNQQIVLDTLVNSISLSNTFEVGEYCWSVRGENFTSQTEFSQEACFSVSAPIDLSEITLNLISPGDNAETNTPNILFRWEEITNASAYNFRLIKVNEGAVQEVVFESTNLNTNEIQLSETEINTTGMFLWEVEAVNNVNNTRTMLASRTFIVNAETIELTTPSLTNPEDNVVIASGTTVNLTWEIMQDVVEGEVLTSTLQISSDQNFTTFEVDQVLQATSFDFIPTILGTFYWRVRIANDEADESDFSEVRSFVVN